MALMPRVRCAVGARTDIGRVRSENQDRMSRLRARCGDVLIVVDGMGGHNGGGVAASMTVSAMEVEFARNDAADNVPATISNAFRLANKDVYERANSGEPETQGMGAAAVVAVITNGKVICGHVGDSRAYLFRRGRLRRLTRDHSRVQRMIDARMLTEAEAQNHPDAGVLERAVGDKPTVEAELSSWVRLKYGDELLLCSDGLCGYIGDAAIARLLSGQGAPQVKAEALVELALEQGGHDNVTVQLMRYGERRALMSFRGFFVLVMLALAVLGVSAQLSMEVRRLNELTTEHLILLKDIRERLGDTSANETLLKATKDLGNSVEQMKKELLATKFAINDRRIADRVTASAGSESQPTPRPGRSMADKAAAKASAAKAAASRVAAANKAAADKVAADEAAKVAADKAATAKAAAEKAAETAKTAADIAAPDKLAADKAQDGGKRSENSPPSPSAAGAAGGSRSGARK